ncbi:alpha/beta-hydrolase [Pleurotus eryngii]|uniref:Carboxypeptidase n=1 Tax=Pleurotus eryngii TaxID=5323 RepID=A0A9P6D586_PLEER|nr:alpha/beta-hydrolase [Pleurotus eryngii]
MYGPLAIHSGSAHYGSEPSIPKETLDALSDKDFTTLRHPAFPSYGVRVKRTRWCDETVKAYTGYIDIQDRHLYFSFFESRSDPDRDDVIFWTNGGPGCSSSTGLLMELGPCRIDAAFVPIFFEHFTEFKGRAFRMAGESYAGRYLPVYASAVYDQNEKLLQQGLTPINLVLLPRCRQWIQSSCIDHFDGIDCYAAAETCEAAIGFPYYQMGQNPYDVSKVCEGGIGSLCYPVLQNITRYLNSSYIRTLLGVDPTVTSFSFCSPAIELSFYLNNDRLHSSVEYIAQLLERDVHVLIYVGLYDWLVHWIGNERWTLDMEWSGKQEFNEQPLRDWVVDGRVTGRTRSAKGLTFTTIGAAGHLVPYDKPRESLEMVQRWLAGRPL